MENIIHHCPYYQYLQHFVAEFVIDSSPSTFGFDGTLVAKARCRPILEARRRLLCFARLTTCFITLRPFILFYFLHMISLREI
jgi:hypothetical protein